MCEILPQAPACGPWIRPPVVDDPRAVRVPVDSILALAPQMLKRDFLRRLGLLFPVKVGGGVRCIDEDRQANQVIRVCSAKNAVRE